jgi:AcrR family transcriptional regulator
LHGRAAEGGMTAPRRIGAEDSETRQALIQAATEIMLEEGYAAVTSRRVAARAGVKPPLVHYYFPSMDDLFLAALRAGAEAHLELQRNALASAEPLRAMWEANTDRRRTGLAVEFMALARHRKEIRSEIAAYAERLREAQLAALTLILRDRGTDPRVVTPMALSVLLGSVSRALVMERDLGMTLGHQELTELIDRYLAWLEAPPPATAPPGRDAPPTPGQPAAPSPRP